MLHPEKNDVNIAKLFHWGNKFEIKDRYGNDLATVFIRLVGDADINKARVFAIRESKNMRDKLKNRNSDEYIAFISVTDEVEDKSALIDVLLAVMTKQLAQEAVKEVKLPRPKELKSDASLEEQEQYQEEVDSYDSRRNEAVGELILKKIDDLQKVYEEKSIEELRKTYERELIKDLCEKEMYAKFKEMCTFLGTYKDAEFKEPLFMDFRDFTNLPTEIKQQFMDCYDELEINIDELKKSLEATQ